MPTHVYKPVHSPPSWWDRVLVHPMETGVSVISGIFGVVVLLGLLLPGFTPSPSLNEILWPLVAVQGVFLAVGGALAFAGLQWAGDDVSTGWALERFGWLVSAGGFLTYGAAVLDEYPDSIISWGLPIALGLASLLRCWSVVRIERAMRISIAEVKGEVA